MADFSGKGYFAIGLPLVCRWNGLHCACMGTGRCA